MRAYSLIRPEPHYRREAFAAGLKAAGYDVRGGPPPSPAECDVLLVWNRYGDRHDLATLVERAGGRVIVAENGYLSAGGGVPKFDVLGGPQAGHYYALALGGHNGNGRWVVGAEDRFARLGVEVKPWRTTGEHILVCPNRSFGVPEQMMPADWATGVVRRLKHLTKRPVSLRLHPGNNRPARSLEEDLENAWAVVVWYSSAGLHALLAGIPVITEARAWLMKDACGTDLRDIENPPRPDRLPALGRLAWAQWTLEEIAGGGPFRRLLDLQEAR